MAFSTGLLVLGFVLVGFAAQGHGLEGQTEVASAVLEPLPDEREQVVSWDARFLGQLARPKNCRRQSSAAVF